MADPKARGIEVTRLCRNKPLTDAQRSNIIALLKDGADLNVRYGPGNTALHYAAEKGHADVVKELLVRGADPSAANDEGKTAADLARAVGNSDVAKVLDSASSKKKTKPIVPTQSTSLSNPLSASPPKVEDRSADPADSVAQALHVTSLSQPELPGQCSPQPQTFSAAERQAIEITITTTLSSPLPPHVTSIGDDANGFGIRLFPDGSLYAGHFMNSLRHGSGAQRWTDGHVYSGEWRDDKKHGRGWYNFSALVDGVLEQRFDRYEGQWHNGCMHGLGKYTHISGDVYEGEFDNNEMQGKAIYTKADGGTISGTFSRGQFILGDE